jgi:cytochrome c553
MKLPHRLCGRLAAALALALTLLPPAHASPPFEDSMAQRMMACTACHGPQGRAAPDGYYPRLAGKPAGYLYNQLINFRDGHRTYPLMTGLLDPLSTSYLLEIAEHFAAMNVPYPAPVPIKATANELQRGEQLVLRGDTVRQLPACVACHGSALTGVQPATPGLLGLPRDYLNAQLGAWRNGLRRAHAPDCMADVAKRLAIEDIAAVSAWLASQRLPAQTHAVATAAAPLPMRCGSAVPPGGAR